MGDYLIDDRVTSANKSLEFVEYKSLEPMKYKLCLLQSAFLLKDYEYFDVE